MPERVEVWAVRLGFPEEGTKGTLELADTFLSFASERGDRDFDIPLSSIRRVRRIMGSPVMIVEQDAVEVAFYFVQPPPLRQPGPANPLGRHRARSQSLTYLGDTNRSKRKEVKEWVAAVKEATS